MQVITSWPSTRKRMKASYRRFSQCPKILLSPLKRGKFTGRYYVFLIKARMGILGRAYTVQHFCCGFGQVFLDRIIKIVHLICWEWLYSRHTIGYLSLACTIAFGPIITNACVRTVRPVKQTTNKQTQ